MARRLPKGWVPLAADPRWRDFVKRYAGDMERFAREVTRLDLSEQQEALFMEVQVPRSRVSVASGHGCFAMGTPVMLSSGEVVPVESVGVGQTLMGGDGASVRKVLQLKRGREAMYRFTYSDGTQHVFNESHILCLVATNSKGRRVAGQKTTTTVREWLTWGEDKKRCHAIYRSEVERFERPSQALPIPAYILGVWLGDGHSDGPRVTTADHEIKQALQEYASQVGLGLHVMPNSANSEILSLSAGMQKGHGKSGKNPVLNALRSLDLLGNKHIPDAYLYADKQTRLELLAGLIDTDGSRDNSGFDFVQKNEGLARQVWWLARSVGCHATIKAVRKTCSNNGVQGDYWRVTIGRNTRQIPVRIARKKIPDGVDQRPNLHFSIKSCEPLGEGDYFGFVLDGDHRFLGGDFTVLHNTGKTTSIATIVLWHLLCHPESVTLLTANDMAQLKATLWKEIGMAIERIRTGPHQWIHKHIDLLANGSMRIRGYEETWFVESKTANEKSANKMAGRHGKWLLIIGDEASTLPETVCTTLNGALTEEYNRFLLTSQPTRNAGFFYDTFNKLSIDNGGEWVNLVFSSEDSPFVSAVALNGYRQTYDDDEYRVRVLGLFPLDSSKHMMSRRVAEAMYTRGKIIKDEEAWGWLLLGDIASGEGLRDKSAIVLAKVIGWGERGELPRRVEIHKIPIFTNKIRSNVLSRYMREEASDFPGITHVVDGNGLGINVVQDLEDKGCTVKKVLWGKRCFRARNQERYINQRAQCMHQAARAAKEGRLSILTPDYKTAMLDQSSRIPKTFSDGGLLKVPAKGATEWEGLGSPDLWDAVCMAFLDDVHYIPALSDSEVQALMNESRRQMDEAADAVFGNVS